mmetsp:Transcript_98337/g.275331  ORF Transcript_98337/g.275331 Transcript_98337/m.275331 type:complete len:172 (-) Transcript_98337:255-770(-)
MAKTAKGMVDDEELYGKILYVSKDRLEEWTKKIAGGKVKDKDVQQQHVEKLLFPEDMDDDKLLVPVDISKSGDDFPTTPEEMTEKLGAKGAVEAIIAAAKLFETSKKKFKKDTVPIPMTVGDWIVQAGAGGTEEGGDEEGGEEEDLEGDEEEELDEDEAAPEPAKKKAKVS